MVDYAQQAADRVGTIAARLQSGGAQGLVDDVTSFAGVVLACSSSARSAPGSSPAGWCGRARRDGRAGHVLASRRSPRLARPVAEVPVNPAPFDIAAAADGAPGQRVSPARSRSCHELARRPTRPGQDWDPATRTEASRIGRSVSCSPR